MSDTNGQKSNGHAQKSNGQTSGRQQPGRLPTGGSKSPASAKYLREVVDSEQSTEMPDAVADMLEKDSPLANLRRADREYFRLLADNVSMYTRERFPPKGSLIQGDVGACLLEDPDYDTEALDEQQRNRIETAILAHFARSSRGVAGWQQDKLNESVQTKRVEDARGVEDQSTEKRGILSRIFSR